MEDKWFFYLTLILTLFAIFLAAGLIPHHHPFIWPGIMAVQPGTAKVPSGLNNTTLNYGHH